MKVTKSTIVFAPVTLTFDTEKELKEFVEKQREYPASDSGLPHLAWFALRDALYGRTQA